MTSVVCHQDPVKMCIMRIAIASQNERKIPCAKESEQSQIHLHFLGLFLGDLFEISLQALDFTC